MTTTVTRTTRRMRTLTRMMMMTMMILTAVAVNQAVNQPTLTTTIHQKMKMTMMTMNNHHQIPQ